jgi:hypothetical protein
MNQLSDTLKVIDGSPGEGAGHRVPPVLGKKVSSRSSAALTRALTFEESTTTRAVSTRLSE